MDGITMDGVNRNGIGGKVVAITGASSGIGEATALELAGGGAAVVLGARRLDRLTALAERIRAQGGRAEVVLTDVRQRADLKGLVGVAVERFGRLDVLVSNAGIARTGFVSDLDVDSWDAMIDINVRGVVHGIAAALPVFRQQGRGHFVTTVSTSGLKISPTQAVYAATKNAVRTMLEALRQSPPTACSAPRRSPRVSCAPSSSTTSMTPRVVNRCRPGWPSWGSPQGRGSRCRVRHRAARRRRDRRPDHSPHAAGLSPAGHPRRTGPPGWTDPGPVQAGAAG